MASGCISTPSLARIQQGSKPCAALSLCNQATREARRARSINARSSRSLMSARTRTTKFRMQLLAPASALAEEARTNRVKRSRPDDRLSHCLRALGHDICNNALNPSHHLGGSAPREGQQHDTTRIGAIDDEMSNAMGKGVGLPRACTRDDQKRACLG